MARRRQEEESENHERWLVSYADFITLLFAFFVVMYALSSINEGKYRVLSNSLVNAFGGGHGTPMIKRDVEPSITPALPRLSPRQRQGDNNLRHEREQLTEVAQDIQKVLYPLVKQGKVRVTQSARGVNVEINASVLFASGDATLTGDSGQTLRAVAEVLKNDDHEIQVEGHTDSVPIKNVKFASNWELSAVRASSVVRLFEDSGIVDERLVAVGRGATQPVATNDTAEGRLRNRRVEITILSNALDSTTEVPIGPKNMP